MKNRSINILITAFVLLGILAFSLAIFIQWAHESFADGITVSENGVTESVLKVRDLRLNPTESKEYSVKLICEATGSYLITLDYNETSDGGMKRFVNVKVKCGGEVVYEGPLAPLLDSDYAIEFEGELDSEEPLPICITYDMPRDVGNEAQGTFSDFDVTLKIKKS
jgi:hypothetical protein